MLILYWTWDRTTKCKNAGQQQAARLFSPFGRIIHLVDDAFPFMQLLANCPYLPKWSYALKSTQKLKKD